MLTDLTYFEGALVIANKNDSEGVKSKLNYLLSEYEPQFLIDVLGQSIYNDFMAALGMQPNGTFTNVDNGVYRPLVTIPSLSYSNGDIFLTGGVELNVGSNYYVNPLLAGYGYSLELRGTGGLQEDVDYVNYVDGGFMLPNLVIQEGQVFVIHLKSFPVATSYVLNPNLKWGYLLNGCDYTGQDNRLHHFTGFIDVRYRYQNIKKSPITNLVYYWYMRGEASQSSGKGEFNGKSDNGTQASPAIKMATAYNYLNEWLNELQYFMQSNITLFPEWQNNYWYYSRRKYLPVNTYGL